MVTKNCANWHTAFSLVVNGYHKIPPTQGRAWVSSALSGAGPDSTQGLSAPFQSRKANKAAAVLLGAGRERLSAKWPPLATLILADVGRAVCEQALTMTVPFPTESPQNPPL